MSGSENVERALTTTSTLTVATSMLHTRYRTNYFFAAGPFLEKIGRNDAPLCRARPLQT